MAIYETVMEWAKYRDYILPALEHSHGSHNEDDVIAGIIIGDKTAGGFKLWMADGAAMITNFVQFPRVKVLNLWLAGGNLEVLMKMESELVAYARANGCAQIRTGGRKGWGRILPGAEEIGTVFAREV